MPCEKPRKKMRPKGRILHFVGSRSKIFQVSPEPNDASNAKFKLSIANYSKTSAICWRHSAKNAKGNRNYAPSFVERVCPTSNSFFHSAAKILCGKSRKISMRWACTGDCRLILARLLRATRVCAPPGASAKTPRGSTVRETRHPRHRHSRVRQSAI